MSGAPTKLSLQLATHLAGVRFEELPPRTVEAARHAILDGFGVMRAASGLSVEVRPFIELAQQHGGAGHARIFGSDSRVSAPWAAFANGAMAHALDFEDAFDRAAVHPNASLLPAALAVAQSEGPISGKEFIAAVAAGCDLACRMALSLRQPLEQGGWYPPPILGAFGAVAACCRLLKLAPQQYLDAFSLLLGQNSMPGEIIHSADTILRAVREAFPAQHAVTCSLLAARGVRGFDAPLEGRAGFYALFAGGHYEPADLLDRLGQHYWIDELSFKPWPCCRGTHAYIELAADLMRCHAVKPTDVQSVEVRGGALQQMLCEPLARKSAPSTSIDAKFSIPFTVATALTVGNVNLGSFSAERLQDAKLRALAARVQFHLLADWGPAQAAAGKLALVLTSGRRVEAELRQARGHPDSPLDEDCLRAKFIDCLARGALPRNHLEATQLAERILRLESEADVGGLFT